jgi:hypothetical protein
LFFTFNFSFFYALFFTAFGVRLTRHLTLDLDRTRADLFIYYVFRARVEQTYGSFIYSWFIRLLIFPGRASITHRADFFLFISYTSSSRPLTLVLTLIYAFTQGADPADVVIKVDKATGQVQYDIPVTRLVEEWALPCLAQTNIYIERASKGLACLDSLEELKKGGVSKGLEDDDLDVYTNGFLSPVTPEHEVS